TSGHDRILRGLPIDHDRFSSVEVQQPAHALAVEHMLEPTDLVRRSEKRVLAVDGRVLALDDVRNFAVRRGRDVADALDVPRDKKEMVRIDLSLLDEAPGFLGATARIGLVDQT